LEPTDIATKRIGVAAARRLVDRSPGNTGAPEGALRTATITFRQWKHLEWGGAVRLERSGRL